MIKTALIFAIALLLVACDGPTSILSSNSTHSRPAVSDKHRVKFENYLAKAKRDAKRGKRVSKSNYLRYEMPDGNEHIYITKKGHPAHPAVVRRTIITRLTIKRLATRGTHGGDQRAFEKWLAEFKALDVNRPRSSAVKPIPVL